jgi:SPP1 family predicted phage head-tail adaptor
MRAGQLRHQITIKAPTHTSDGMGGVTTTWGTVATCWAAVEPLRGREWVESNLENAELTGKVVMRYKSGILPTYQVYFGSRTFEILSVIDVDERRKEIQLMVRELVVA